MIDSLVREQPHFIQGFRDELLLAPVNIPIIFFGLFICASLHGGLDAVDKVGLEPDFSAALLESYGWRGKYSFLMYFRKYYDIARCNLILSIEMNKLTLIHKFSFLFLPSCSYSEGGHKIFEGKLFWKCTQRISYV